MNYPQLHLLLADDDADDREFFQEALENTAFSTQLTTVQDGQELMQWLTQKRVNLPDLLFLDLNMPRKSGYECLAEIKQNPDLHELPVIILTTAANPSEIEKLYQIGAQNYIQKPSDFVKLAQVIEQVLRSYTVKNIFEHTQIMTTTKKIGIWMDSESAHFMDFNNESNQDPEIESTFTHEAKEIRLGKNENIMHNKEQHQQADYYKRLGEVIINYDEVLLFGPTNAKAELVNILKSDHHFDKIKIEVLPAEKMTENQLHAFVKDYFSKTGH